MASFFNEAFYSNHSPSSSSPLQQPMPTTELDIQIDQTLDDAVDFLSSSDVDKLISSSPRTNTPQIQRLFETPPSSVAHAPSSSADAKIKRVDFAPFTSTNWGWAANAAPSPQKENSSATLLKKLQPSRERSTLRSKSILKATRSRGNEQSSSPEMQSTTRTWDQVLDFGLKQLRSEKPGMRLDAWRSMQQFLATSPEISAIEGIAEKHNAVLAGAIRDIAYTGQDQENGLPNQLPNFALKFMSKFVQLPGELSSASLATLLDLTIDQLQHRELSKNLARCYLEFLYLQNFGPEIMTSTRMRRVVEAFHALGLHQTSSGILLDEMKVCRKFVDQCPEGMIASASSWLDICLHGAFSDDAVVLKFIVETMFDVSVKLGHRAEISKALQKLLRTVVDAESGRTTLQHLEQDLTEKADFAKDSTIAMLVPKLLSSLFMLSRAKGPSAVFGEHFRHLVAVTKPYFMKTSASIASHAYTAWSWLIIAQVHGGRWPDEQSTFLRRPIENVLMKSNTELDLDKATPAYSLSIYLVLLYCSFTPDARLPFMKQKWDLYVKDVLDKMVTSKAKSQTSLARSIFTALLASDTPWDAELLIQPRKPWNSTMLEVNDLARVDSSWIRGNLAGSVLPLLDRFMKSPHRADHAVASFKALLDAIAFAGANEIVPTKEAKAAVAELTNYLTHLWNPYSRKAKDMVLFGQLLELLVSDSPTSATKAVIFTEKILRKSSGSERLEVATTPSNRSSNQPTSAIAHFLSILTRELVEQYPRSELSPEQDEPSVLFDMIKRLAERLCLCEVTLIGKITVLCTTTRRLIHMKQDSSDNTGRAYVDELCQHSLVFVTSLIKESDVYGHSSKDSLETVYPQLVSLMADVACHCNGISDQLTTCYRAVVERAQSALGPGGALVSITEATARSLQKLLLDNPPPDFAQSHNDTMVHLAKAIIDTAPGNIPSADIRRALERAGGARFSASAKKSDLLEVYHLTNSELSQAYNALSQKVITAESLSMLCSAIATLLKKQSAAVALEHVKVMQPGIAAVVMDKQGLVGRGGTASQLSTSVYDLWSTVVMKGLFDHVAQAHLITFDELIASSLSSRATRIVNDSVAAWNRGLGADDSLEYPVKTAKALRKLRAMDVDVAVSSPLPAQDGNAPDSPLVVETTEQSSDLADEADLPTPRPIKMMPRLTVSPAPSPSSVSRRRLASTTPKSKPKPRHEDSQIHFEPIPSSPLPQRDNQVLTERQLEVAERQREGSAALFAETSTPIKAAQHVGPDLGQDIDITSATPSTPVLAAAHDDAIPSSSPVVASVRRRESSVRRTGIPELALSPAMPLPQDDLPSSPPTGPADGDALSSDMPPVPTLTLDRDEILRKKRLGREQTSSQEPVIAAVAHLSDTENRDDTPSALHKQSGSLNVPSSVPEQAQSFNSIISIPLTMTDSTGARVKDSFVGPREEQEPLVEEHSDIQDTQESQDFNQDSVPNDSQTTDSQRKRRRRGRTSFASVKKRKTAESHVYNTTEFIRFKPKPRFTTPEDMLPVIVVKEVDEENDEPESGAGAEMEEEIQVPATTKRGRGRPRKSLEKPTSEKSAQVSRKRGRPSTRGEDVEDDADEHNGKRNKVDPKTPSSRERSVSSVHFVEITPGDASGRRSVGSTRTDTPEVEEFVSASQQIQASDDDEVVDETVILSTCEDIPSSPNRQIEAETTNHPQFVQSEPEKESAIITSQIDETQIDDGFLQDDGDDFHSVRGDSPAPSMSSSQASSQGSQASQLSSFSVSAFKGVMSRFVDQIKEYVSGGSHQATEEAARQMAEEANRTVERLARQVKRNR